MCQHDAKRVLATKPPNKPKVDPGRRPGLYCRIKVFNDFDDGMNSDTNFDGTMLHYVFVSVQCFNAVVSNFENSFCPMKKVRRFRGMFAFNLVS